MGGKKHKCYGSVPVRSVGSGGHILGCEMDTNHQEQGPANRPLKRSSRNRDGKGELLSVSACEQAKRGMEGIAT